MGSFVPWPEQRFQSLLPEAHFGLPGSPVLPGVAAVKGIKEGEDIEYA